MSLRLVKSLMICWFGLLIAGCTIPPDARYVYQDGEYGVVGIPFNSSLGRKDYREQANELMLRHFPNGYEVVRAEEVVEGERTLDRAIKRELETEPEFAALNQMLKVGKFAKSSSFDQKDTTHITESRIIYRRKDPKDAKGLNGFASVSSLAPELYLDPNVAARNMNKELLVAAAQGKKNLEKEKDKDKDKILVDVKIRDDGVQRAGAVRTND